MSKTSKYKKLHDDLSDCVEHLATYGVDKMSAEDLTYLSKMSHLAEEYLRIMEEEVYNGNFDEEEEEIFGDEEEQ